MVEAALYAWGIGAFGTERLPDHTWVTTYDCQKNTYPNIGDVKKAGEDFWFCWGDFHPQCRNGNPSGALGKKSANLALARCLVEPNKTARQSKASRGTIFRYGFDGVCHQVSNQVLYATGFDGTKPSTVANARGYRYSIFRYGTYGVPRAEKKFFERVKSCSSSLKKELEEKKDRPTMPDEFEVHAREVLGKQDPKLLRDLLSLREKALRTVAGNSASAKKINDQNQQLFDEAAELLGPTRFERVFGFPPSQRVTLVEPQFMRPEKAKKAEAAKTNPAVGKQAAPLVTLRVIAATLAKHHEMSKKEAEVVLGDLVGNIVKHLKKGERIRIGGLGILQVRKRAARIGRNPATGKPIHIGPSKKVAFRASKELKEKI